MDSKEPGVAERERAATHGQTAAGLIFIVIAPLLGLLLAYLLMVAIYWLFGTFVPPREAKAALAEGRRAELASR